MSMPSRLILFADDDVLTQWIMTDVLSQAGFDVVSACRGSEATELLAQQQAFDLLVTDLDLPDNLSGHQLAEHWRASHPGRPVIYTGTPRRTSMPILARHEYFIEKPLSPARLLRLIDVALDDAMFGAFVPQEARRGAYVH
jgi:two-component system NtrC family sensor kinase